ncbi:MAG: hypothetical protein KC518_05035 [Candidatus Cloacimonetes bacterium]|nr:hypothetical protein [Candidatus Cloacimonadota bacterium]
MSRRVLAVVMQVSRLQLRSPLLWGLLGLCLLAVVFVNPAAMVPTGKLGVAGLRPTGNSVYALAQTFSLSGMLFYTFLVSLIAGRAALRDGEVGIEPLLHSTPLRPGEYLLGTLAGVLLVLGGVLLLHVLAAMAWMQFGALLGSTNALGPFQAGNYLLAALCFTAPGLLLCACLSFAIGVHARNTLALFPLPVALIFLSMAGLLPASSEGGAWLSRIFAAFDIYGTRWLKQTFFASDRGLAFYNTADLELDRAFLLNRGTIVCVSLLAMLCALYSLRARLKGAGSSVRTAAGSDADAQTGPALVPLAGLGMETRPPGVCGSLLSVARIEFLRLVRHPGIWLFLLLAVLLVGEHASTVQGVFGSRVIHRAGSLAIGLLGTVAILGCLLLLFVVVDSLDRPRRTGLFPLQPTAPSSRVAQLLGSQLAGAGILLLLLLAMTVAGVCVLLSRADAAIEVGPFVWVWSGVLVPTFAFWIAFIALAHNLVRSKAATLLVALLLLATTFLLALMQRLDWLGNWLLLGSLRWSDPGFLELHGRALLLNRIWILSLAFALQAIALRVVSRRRPDRLGSPLRSAPGRAWRLLPLCLPPLLAGSWLFLELRAGFQHASVDEAWALYDTRNHVRWSKEAPPGITHLDLALDLYPDLHRMRVRGEVTLVSTGQDSLWYLPFTVGLAFDSLEFTVNDQAARAEDRNGLRLIRLKQALDPGDSLRAGFRFVTTVPAGLTRNGGAVSSFILPSSVMLGNGGPEFLPVPGFMPDRATEYLEGSELEDLPPGYWNAELPPLAGPSRPFTTRLELSLPEGLQVCATGQPTTRWSEQGRSHSIWESRAPVRALCVVAGVWEKREGDGVTLYHNREHARNVEGMLRTLESGRELYSEWFGELPWSEVRLCEYPDHVSRAQGFPGLIAFSEGMGFHTAADSAGIFPAAVVAHELAHQWWGNLLMPGRGPGADVLIEGMANYCTLLALEHERGDAARVRYALELESRYAQDRRRDSERPLVESTLGPRASELTVVYDKGAWAFWMLQQELGRDHMRAGLRAFIDGFRDSPDHPVLQDLLAVLMADAPDPERLRERWRVWFERVELPEFQLEAVRLDQDGADWLLQAVVRNLGSGSPTVDLAMEGDGQEQRLRLELAEGDSCTVRTWLPFQPTRLVLDPDAHVLQLNRERAQHTLL